jgi:hypothetical protein
VTAFALEVCQPADGQKIRAVEQPDTVRECQALARLELIVDVLKAGGTNTRREVEHLVIG